MTTPSAALQRLFRTAPPLPNLAPCYNIAPSQEAPVVGLRKDRETRGLAMLRPLPAEKLRAYKVSIHVNAPQNGDPGCTEPLAD